MRSRKDRRRPPPGFPEAEALFRSAFDDAPIGMALSSPDGRYLRVNRALCDILGRTEAELLATSWQEVTHPDDRAALAASERNALSGAVRTFQMEKRYLASDGRVVWTLISRSLLTGGGDEPVCFLSHVVEITDRKAAMEALRSQKEELAALHETTLGLIDRLEPTSLLEAILSRAAALMGTPHAYLYTVDEAADELVVRAGTGVFTQYIGYRLGRGQGLAGRVWERGEPIAVDDYHTWSGRRSGFEFLRAAAGIPLRTGSEIVGVLGLVLLEEGRRFGQDDIALLGRFGRLASLALENARLYHAAQQELAERRHAEKELERIAEELRQANEDLRATDEMKSDFIAVASHELRTPLTAVLGFATTLQKHWDRLAEGEKLDQVRLIEEQARLLARLTDDLLILSRIEAGGLETRPEVVEVDQVIADALRTFPEHADHVSVDVDHRLRIRADRAHVLRILSNYLSNAISYGRPPFSVEASAADDRVEIRVRDRGGGVPPDFVPRLFEKFAQAHGPDRPRGGSGLGLSIVRGLARAQDGEAWYEPNAPTGSCFGVRFPAAAS